MHRDELLEGLAVAAEAPSKMGAESMRHLLEAAIAEVELCETGGGADLRLDPEASIHARLVAVTRDVRAVGKNQRNIDTNYSARSIDDVLAEVHRLFKAHGVTVLPDVVKAEYRDVTIGQKKSPMREATVRVRMTFVGLAGDTATAVFTGEALDVGDKATGKAMSNATKYGLLTAFTIPVHDLPDADELTPERSTASEAEPDELKAFVDKDLGAAIDALYDAVYNSPADLSVEVEARYHDRMERGATWAECPTEWIPAVIKSLSAGPAETPVDGPETPAEGDGAQPAPGDEGTPQNAYDGEGYG